MKRKIVYISLAVLFIISFFLDKIIYEFMKAIRFQILTNFMLWITNITTLFIVLVLISILFLWNEKKKEWIPVLLISLAFAWLLSFVLKYSFLRPRPEGIIFEGDPSFPSMHSASAFAAIPILNREFPKIKWFWILFALLVAFSRLYLGVHYLSDVIFGIILGLAIGDVFVYIEEKYRPIRKFFKLGKRKK